ncbi:MAG: DnaJ domain-containing protein [Novosphingobium sp.]
MTKFLLLAALGVLAYRLIAALWPWEPRRGNARSVARAQARVLLGVSESASREEIIDAHRRLVAQVHPDRGGTNELVHEANSARDLLLAERPVR